MTKLEGTTYKEFGKLRFLDFFKRTTGYCIDMDGGFECPIGLADWEGYGPEALFIGVHKPLGAEWQTCGINLDFDAGCPEAEAHKLLDHIGVPLRRGMPDRKVRELLGRPDKEEYPGWPRFTVGKQYSYYLQCGIRDQCGLIRVSILRKDLADKEQERLRER